MAIADTLNIDPFDRPVAGQGMTAAPGSRIWEQPSQFSNPKEAVEYVIQKIDSREEAKDEMLNLLASGSPLESIVNTISFGGFTEGKWTPDDAELIKMPITGYLIGLAMQEGIDVTMFNVPLKDQDTTKTDDLAKVMASNRPEQFDKLMNDLQMAEEMPDDIENNDLRMEDIEQSIPQDQGGFMPRREIE